MNTSERDSKTQRATSVEVTVDALIVALADGRILRAMLSDYPRLVDGSTAERSNWRLIGGGRGIHWPDLDEDINVESLASGKKSHETAESLSRWLAQRKTSA
jgi:hypothetical protein